MNLHRYVNSLFILTRHLIAGIVDVEVAVDPVVSHVTAAGFAVFVFDADHPDETLVFVVDLVGVCGYYMLVSMTLNVFEMPLPPGEPDPLA